MEKTKKNRHRSKISGNIISIKLYTSIRNKEKMYEELIQQMHNEKIIGELNGHNRMLIRTLFKGESEGQNFFYGQFSKFTSIDGDDWLNTERLERDTYNLPANLFPNMKDINYVFVPKAHRFFIRRGSGISEGVIVKFLRSAIKKTLSSEEQLDVNIELSEDIIDRILSAQEVHEITIDISYSNDDTNEATADFIDKQLKRAQAARAKFSFKADSGQNIQVNDTIIEGALELSRTNGSATARVINMDGKHETIQTSEHPKIYTVVVAQNVSVEDATASSILLNYRNDE